jgi:hypothetical protein
VTRNIDCRLLARSLAECGKTVVCARAVKSDPEIVSSSQVKGDESVQSQLEGHGASGCRVVANWRRAASSDAEMTPERSVVNARMHGWFSKAGKSWPEILPAGKWQHAGPKSG